jgi:anti-sigma28 factor (negative regulator of flagellin synthesis)
MEISEKSEALKSFLGVSTLPASTRPNRRLETAQPHAAFTGDQVSLSAAGSKIHDSAGQGGMRMERVTAVQEALAAGTYGVSPLKVADKVIESMVSDASRPQS